MQSVQVQLLHVSSQELHWQVAWLQVGQAHSAQTHSAQVSEQCAQVQTAHSS